MDISETLAPKSDQLDAVDLRGKAPQVFTVTKVDVKIGADQPVSIHLAEFPRVWRPGKNQRRVLAYCWGSDSSDWTGHQAELYCDDRVSFGGEEIGGTRISRLSHIDGTKKVPLITGKGKNGIYTVKPLPTSPPPAQPVLDDDENARAIDDLTAEWHTADADRKKAIEANVAALRAGATS